MMVTITVVCVCLCVYVCVCVGGGWGGGRSLLFVWANALVGGQPPDTFHGAGSCVFEKPPVTWGRW